MIEHFNWFFLHNSQATEGADKDQADLLSPLKTRHQKTATIVGVMAEPVEITNQQISTIVGIVTESPEKVAEGSCLKNLFLCF